MPPVFSPALQIHAEYCEQIERVEQLESQEKFYNATLTLKDLAGNITSFDAKTWFETLMSSSSAAAQGSDFRVKVDNTKPLVARIPFTLWQEAGKVSADTPLTADSVYVGTLNEGFVSRNKTINIKATAEKNSRVQFFVNGNVYGQFTNVSTTNCAIPPANTPSAEDTEEGQTINLPTTDKTTADGLITQYAEHCAVSTPYTFSGNGTSAGAGGEPQEGSYFQIQTVDDAGNRSKLSAPVYVYYDVVVPVSLGISVINDDLYITGERYGEASITMKSPSGVETVNATHRLNGEGTTTEGAHLVFTDEFGTYTIETKIFDAAGNTKGTSMSIERIEQKEELPLEVLNPEGLTEEELAYIGSQKTISGYISDIDRLSNRIKGMNSAQANNVLGLLTQEKNKIKNNVKAKTNEYTALVNEMGQEEPRPSPILVPFPTPAHSYRYSTAEVESVIVSMTPIGGGVDLISALVGKDVITMQDLTLLERALYGSSSFVPILSGATLVKAIKGAKTVSKVGNVTTKLIRYTLIAGLHIADDLPLNTRAITHIFDGEVKNGVAAGFHHISSSIGKVIEKIPGRSLTLPDGSVAYEATVSVNGVVKDVRSTMWPDNWSRQKIVDTIDKAYRSPNIIKTKGGAFDVLVDGFTVKLILNTDASVKTAYILIP